jgi:very-short-patch-repair endonuclease
MIYNCNDCNKEFDTFIKLQTHNSKVHKIPASKSYVDNFLNGIWPLCECGCKENLTYFPGKLKFGKFILGHAARVNGGFYSKEGAINSGKTRKKKFKSGELVQWNKGKEYTTEQYNALLKGLQNPIRGAKISKALKGKPKTEEHRLKLLDGLARNRKEILKGNPSKLEFTFADILTGIGIEFVHQFNVEGFDYDFYIPSKNMLIEVDGDYWHSNPIKFTVLNNMQKKNKGLDKLKNIHAERHNYTLQRFWEHDINNNRIEVIQKLINLITT